MPKIKAFDSGGNIVVGATVKLQLTSTFWAIHNPNYIQYFYATTNKDGIAVFHAQPAPTFGTFNINIGSSLHSIDIDTLVFTSGGASYGIDVFRLALVQPY